MFPYYVLVIVPIALNVFLTFVNKNDKVNKYTISIFFLIYFLLLALRDLSIGTDLTNYISYYKQFGETRWNALFESKVEPGYVLLCKIVYSTGANFQTFLAIVAAIEIIPIAVLYKNRTVDSVLEILLFLNIGIFSMLFSGLRQSIAISLGTVAYRCLKRQGYASIILFFLVVLLAISMHKSAFILLLMPFLYYPKFTKKSLFFILPILFIIFVFKRQIFNFIFKLLPKDYTEYGLSDTHSYGMLISYVLCTMFSFFVVDEQKADKELFALRNFAILSICIQCFAPINTVAMRFNYYYIIFIPLLISRSMKYSRNEIKTEILLSIRYVLIGFSFLWFFYNAYTSVDILNIFPYQFFWSNK